METRKLTLSYENPSPLRERKGTYPQSLRCLLPFCGTWMPSLSSWHWINIRLKIFEKDLEGLRLSIYYMHTTSAIYSNRRMHTNYTTCWDLSQHRTIVESPLLYCIGKCIFNRVKVGPQMLNRLCNTSAEIWIKLWHTVDPNVVSELMEMSIQYGVNVDRSMFQH